MGKQKPKDIDLSAFDAAIGSTGDIDLSAFDNEVKKKPYRQQSPTIGEPSVIGSSNPLNPNIQRPADNFNFVQQEDPETYNTVQAQTQQRKQAQSNRLNQIGQVYDQAQGQGATSAIQQQAQNRPVDTLTDPAIEPYSGIGNNIAVGLNKTYEGLLKVPRFIYSAAAVPQNFLADQLDMPGLEAKYDNFLQMTNATPVTSPLTMLDQLGDYYGEEAEGYAAKTQKYDDTITGSLSKGNFKQAGSQILDQIAESAPSIAVMAMTSGAGNTAGLSQTAKTLANALPFMSQRNAELQDDGSVPEWLKPINAAANGLAEVVFDQSFGTQAAIQGIVNKFQSEGREAAVNAAKELTGSFLNGALKTVAAIKPFAKGAIEEASTQLAQNIVDKYTIDPDKDLMEGVGDAAIVGSAMTGGLVTAGNIALPTQRTQVRELETQQQALLNELGNENLSPESREAVGKIIEGNQSTIESIAKETQEAIAKLNPAQKKEVSELNDQAVAAEAIVSDPNASEEVKKVAEQQIETISKEIDAIKPEKEVLPAPKEETGETVKKGTDVAIDDTIELVGGKKGTVTKVEGDQITMTMENGATFMATPELVEMTNVTPKEAVQETIISEPVETTTEVKETITEPINEVEQPEVTTEEVVEENLPEKRTEEVLAKAETDLAALKQVTDKTKKYEASLKRLTEAKNNKEITTAEFNDLKKRFDDVIGDSIPKVKGDVVDVIPEQVEEAPEVEVVAEASITVQEETAPTESVIEEVPVVEEKSSASEDFKKITHKNIQSDEVSSTLNNVERETGRELTEDEKEYRVTKRNDALNHGAEVVERAKEEFGKTYVPNLLNYLNENASTLSLENRALINISLELDLERQLVEDPDNITLNKQLKLVRDASTKFQRSAAIATGYGILRQIARVGYDISQVTDQFFSEQQLADKAKLNKAIEATPEDINKESDSQEQDIDLSEDFNVTPKPRKKQFGLTEQQQQEKAELAKQFRGVFNDVTRIATLLADKKFMRYAKLVFLDTAGDFETFAKNMIESVGDGIKQHLPTIYKKVGGTDGVTEKTDAQKAKDKSIRDIVKKALIDKGYGRDITVTLNERDADGKKIKEKRKVLDWKKLAGEEGSVDNIRDNVESALLESGYSQSDINAIQTDLVAEYNRLHASIIEKSLNELQSRNQEREPIDVKTSAKKLAELYNYGLFDEQADTYDNIVNRAIGLSEIGEKAFQEAKVLAKALSDLYRSTDANGRKITEFGLKEAIRNINGEIERLLSDVAWEQSNKAFKIATVAKEFMGLSQRAMLQTIKQILENPLSGYVQRAFTKLGYAIDGVDTQALSKKRSEAARIIYDDIVRNGGLNYGEIITPFVTRGAFEKKLDRMSENRVYHTALSALLGRAYLDGADSMHKSALTERYFVHNLVRVLMKKGMPKQEATEFVSNQLTGQKFTDALGSAKQIIDKANEDAGKKIIPDNPNAIYRLAQNIVKDALVVGENITLREVEASYKSAYKAAGYDLGHEANNIVSETVSNATTKLENSIKTAIKEKKWNHAAALTFTSILTKNIINPFVSGGTNWIVLSLQKAGVDVVSPIVDYARQKENKLDLTTKEGVKNMENALLSEMRYKNTMNRVVIGGMATLLVAAAAVSTGADDDLAAWIKKNDWAKKYFKVISPQALILLVAQENKQVADYLIGLFGFTYDSFSDTKKLTQAFQGLSADKKKSQEKGSRKLGEVLGGHTSFPGPWRVARDVENIYRGTQGKKPVKPDYNKGGFWDGYLRNGVVEYFMLER